jgi:hypothetical protein
VVDDPDAVGGLFVHWIVTGIAPGSGSSQAPANGRSLPNSSGKEGYFDVEDAVGQFYRFAFVIADFHHPLTRELLQLCARQPGAGFACYIGLHRRHRRGQPCRGLEDGHDAGRRVRSRRRLGRSACGFRGVAIPAGSPRVWPPRGQ